MLMKRRDRRHNDAGHSRQVARAARRDTPAEPSTRPDLPAHEPRSGLSYGDGQFYRDDEFRGGPLQLGVPRMSVSDLGIR